MSVDFNLATNVTNALAKMRQADMDGVMPRNSQYAERLHLAVERAAERIGAHILRGAELPLKTQDNEDLPSDKVQESQSKNTYYDAQGLRNVSIQERAVLLAMYGRLRANVRCDRLSQQTRKDFWAKDFSNTARDVRFNAESSRQLLQIYAELLMPQDDNSHITSKVPLSGGQALDLDSGTVRQPE